MSEEIDLASTGKKVGQLLPVLVNPKGEIVDGRHRLKANKNWKKVTLDLDDLQTHVARLVINTQRRIADEEDYNELAQFLRKSEPGDKPYRVKSGKSIAQRISELTGIPLSTVYDNLGDDQKQNQEKVTASVTFGRGKSVRVPKPLAEPLREVVDKIKKLVEAEPEKTEEILKNCAEGLKVAAALSQPRKKRKHEKTETKDEDWSPEHFVKKLNKASSQLTFLIDLPKTIVRQVLKEMNDLNRETCRIIIRDLVEAATKLQYALEEASE